MTAVNPRGYRDAMPLERDPDIPDLVSLTEAADILGSSRPAAHKRAVNGRMKGADVGGLLVFRREVVEDLAEKKRQREEARARRQADAQASDGPAS